MSNNFPELVLGEDDYEAKRAVSKSWQGNEYVVDRHNWSDCTFTLDEADTL